MNTISKAAYEGDIVSRLRNWRGLHIAHSGRLYEEAADEIERLCAMLPHVHVHPGVRHTPAIKGECGLPPDVPQADNALATSGRGHFLTPEEREVLEQATWLLPRKEADAILAIIGRLG